MATTGPRNLVTDVPGILVGQAEDRDDITGTTIVLTEQPAMASVDVRGGAPGSRETGLLALETLGDRVDAIVLSGGAALGLDAAARGVEGLSQGGVGSSRRDTCAMPAVP